MPTACHSWNGACAVRHAELALPRHTCAAEAATLLWLVENRNTQLNSEAAASGSRRDSKAHLDSKVRLRVLRRLVLRVAPGVLAITSSFTAAGGLAVATSPEAGSTADACMSAAMPLLEESCGDG